MNKKQKKDRLIRIKTRQKLKKIMKLEYHDETSPFDFLKAEKVVDGIHKYQSNQTFRVYESPLDWANHMGVTDFTQPYQKNILHKLNTQMVDITPGKNENE